MIKNSAGFYDVKSLKTIKIDELIKLLIVESSYQETMNVVRLIASRYKPEMM